MRARLRQYLAMCGISLGGALRAKWMTATVITSVAIVVVVLMGFQAMAAGFRQTLRNTGSDSIAVLMSQEASSETSSQVSREQVELLRNAPAVVRDANGTAVSPEVAVIATGRRRADGSRVNLTIRGLGPAGVALRPGFRLVSGRMFEVGRNEIIAGRGISSEVKGLDLGAQIRLGNVEWKVVGIFALDAHLFESEIWAAAASVQSGFGRANQFQSVRARLASPDSLADLTLFTASDPRLDLNVQTEKSYYAKQSEGSVNVMQYLGWPLALVLSIGAIAGTFNAMLISIQSRKREIAIVRQLGFERGALFASILVESIALSAVGALLGTVLAYLLFNGVLTSTLGTGFTTITYALRVDRTAALQALLLALSIGVFGGLVPAWRGIAATTVSKSKARTYAHEE